jgi:hypothetical protein
MSSEIPMTEVKETREGKLIEGVKFDIQKLCTYLVHHFGLDEFAKNGSIEMAITVDAAQLDDNVTRVTIGFKIVDKKARDPITKKLIYSELQNMQSGQWYFLIMTILAKDSKDTYNHFHKPIFDESEELRTNGLGDWKPFQIPDPQDMKSHQLTLGCGGAAKVVKLFCHSCLLQSEYIAIRNEIPCDLVTC